MGISWEYDMICDVSPPTPADSKGERVREERLWTTTNTTTGLGKLSKVAAAVAAAEQRQW